MNEDLIIPDAVKQRFADLFMRFGDWTLAERLLYEDIKTDQEFVDALYETFDDYMRYINGLNSYLYKEMKKAQKEREILE